jgi:tRNA1Val (adenine37-N6)-methyltransferase
VAPDVNNRSEFFSWRGLTIYQHDKVLKVGIDAVLLGSWIREVVPVAYSILDAGTGTGILAMIAAGYFPEATISAVDIDEQSVSLAQFNVVQGGLESRISVIKSDLLDPSFALAERLDLIVCNPPFYANRVLPKEAFNARSKHSSVPVGEWMKQLVANLKKDGHLCLIVPTAEAHIWICAANESGYYNHHRTDVYSYASDTMAKRSLLHFTTQLWKPEFKRLVVYSEDKNYTSEYLSMSGIQPTQIHPC